VAGSPARDPARAGRGRGPHLDRRAAGPRTARRARPPGRTIQGYLRILQSPLAGVHALRPADICALTLDDVNLAAGTLLAGGRVRPLERLTAGHLRAWLAARHARWPATANPHLLINRSTAGGLPPVNRGCIHAAVRRLGITAQELRADRLLAEAQASGGDPLKLTHLFGISDPIAIRYCAELEQITVPRSPDGRPA
jgi:integrase